MYVCMYMYAIHMYLCIVHVHCVLCATSYVERELIPAEEVEEKVQKQFVCRQLLSIFSVLDLTDEVGK